MDFTAVIASLLRRWYVVVAGLFVAAGLVAAAIAYVPPTYSATGSLLLTPPTSVLEPGDNPLLQLGGLEQPSSLAVAYLSGDHVQRAFAEKYPGATFTVGPDPLSRGPLLVFTTDAPTPELAVSSLQGAVELLPEALTALQDAVQAPDSARVGSASLTIDTEAKVVRGTMLRAVILAGGIGLALAFAGAVAVDSLMTRRGLRRTARRRSASDESKRSTVPSTVPAGPSTVPAGPSTAPAGPSAVPAVATVASPEGALSGAWTRRAASQRRT